MATTLKPKKLRKKAHRLFPGDDAAFIQSQHVLRKHFTNYLPLFIAYDTAFDIPFADNWQSKITECEELPTDDSNVAEQSGIAAKLKEQVLLLIKKISDVEYYANKAFADDEEALYEFQFQRVQRPDQYNLQFIIDCATIRLLAKFHYEAPLLAAGMSPTLLDEINTQIGNAAAVEMQHELTKRLRIQRARVRVKTLNQLFKISEQVKQAAAVIFFDKPDERALFG